MLTETSKFELTCKICKSKLVQIKASLKSVLEPTIEVTLFCYDCNNEEKVKSRREEKDALTNE